MKKQKHLIALTYAAIIAALYVLLTFLSAGLASGVIQLRLAEALSVLPYFTPAAIPGLFGGCILANLLTGCAPWDVVFGSLATLLGASVAYLIRRFRYLTPLPNILANTLIVPFVLRHVYGAEEALPFLFFTVGIGEILSSGVLGIALLLVLNRYAGRLFPSRSMK